MVKLLALTKTFLYVLAEDLAYFDMLAHVCRFPRRIRSTAVDHRPQRANTRWMEECGGGARRCSSSGAVLLRHLRTVACYDSMGGWLTLPSHSW